MSSAHEAPDTSAVPVYHEFFHNHEAYERYHIHLVGLASSNKAGGSGGGSGGDEVALKVRRNWFGTPRIMDAIADPYITVKTLGSDTGSTDYFPIGKFQFPVLHNCQTPLWDSKCVLLGKKGSTEGITFTFLDMNRNRKDEVLFQFTLSREEMPNITSLKDSKWTRFSIIPPDAPDYQDVTLEFHIMVTDGAERIIRPEDTQSMYECIAEGYSYEETVIPSDSSTECDNDDDDDNALLQSWRHPDNPNAVLWILGRNDCFMHNHVARRLFFENGYDVFVLNYKMNGHCRKQGWVTDPHFNSHNKSGNFDVYIHDISGALQVMADTKDYDILLGYAHSTGGPVLLNYLMEQGDAVFDAFLFNSPFLDWGFVGGDMIEFVLENTDVLAHMSALENDTKVGTAATPEALTDTPIPYLGQDIVYSDWSARLWSLYHFDCHTSPL